MIVRKKEFSEDIRGQKRVSRVIRAWIREGRIGAGDPLPPMRRVAEALDVDKGTVQRAMVALREQGLVRREGRRIHVAKPDRRSSESRLAARIEDKGLLSDTVLVLTSVSLDSTERRAGGWPVRLVEGLLNAGHEKRLHPMLVHPQSLGDASFSRLVAGRPIGCVIVSTHRSPGEDLETLEMLDAAGVPVVLFGEELDAPGHHVVTGDHAAGARMLTGWLHERGRRRVLRYWPFRINRERRPLWLEHRDRGFVDEARRLGLEVIEPLEFPRPWLDGLAPAEQFAARVRHAAGYLVEHLTGPQPIDAVMVASDRLAYEVAAACRLVGIAPNVDVSIVGYDADASMCEESAWEAEGPMVTVAQDDKALGTRMVDVLTEAAGSKVARAQRIAVKPRLVDAKGIEIVSPSEGR